VSGRRKSNRLFMSRRAERPRPPHSDRVSDVVAIMGACALDNGFMAATHAQGLAVFPLHEPGKVELPLNPRYQAARQRRPTGFMVATRGWRTVATTYELPCRFEDYHRWRRVKSATAIGSESAGVRRGS